MKKCVFFLVYLSFSLFQKQIVAQSMPWLWAKSAAGIDRDFGISIATDASANIYVTGGYAGTNIAVGTTTLTNSSFGGMFIVKYNSSGNVIWAQSQGGAGGAASNGISIDPSGNVFVTGQFGSPSIVFGTFTLTQAGGANDFFIVKYDPNGNVLWAKSAGGTGSDVGKSIAIDNYGNALVTGYFKSPTITFGTSTLTGAGVNDCFTVKYDPYGFLLWAKSAGGANWDQGTSIAADVNGNSLVTGYFLSSSITFGTYTLSNSGGYDIYIVKYDPNGTVLWAKSSGGTGSDVGNSISTDSNGNVFLTGTFQSPLIGFGTNTLTNNNSANPNMYITKYNSAGLSIWAKSASLVGEGYGICTDAGGNAYVTGYFSSSSMAFGTTTLTNNGQSNIYVAKYDALGNELASAAAGGNSSDAGNAVNVDLYGNVYVIGDFTSPSLTIGTTTLNNLDVTNNTSDIFIAHLGLCASIPQPPTDITPFNNKNLCDFSSTTLSVTGTGIISWYTSPSSSLALSSGSTFVTPTLSVGHYTYYAEAYTCTNSISRTAVTVSVDACLGITNLSNASSQISIYPNPFQDKLVIDSGEQIIENLCICNSLGEIILQKNKYDGSQNLNVSSLRSGIYFVKLRLGNEQRVFKIMKE